MSHNNNNTNLVFPRFYEWGKAVVKEENVLNCSLMPPIEWPIREWGFCSQQLMEMISLKYEKALIQSKGYFMTFKQKNRQLFLFMY